MAVSRAGTDAMAYYLWPPRWVDAAPVGSITNGISSQVFDQGSMADVVFESVFPGGLELKVCRDGLFVWKCAEWGGKPRIWPDPDDKGHVDPEPEIRFQTRCLRLMNTHLACLLQFSSNQLARPQVLAPTNFLHILFQNCRVHVGNSDDPGSMWLYLGRLGPLSQGDPRRLRTAPVVSIESLRSADDLLRQILELDSSEMALFRAESIYRGVVAYRDFDHGAALVNAWVAIEGLLGDLFARYLEEERERDSDGGKVFIDSKRRDFLEGSSVTSRLTAEILSLADELPHRLYREIRECAKARNKWMHDAAPDAMSGTQAALAIRVAGQMFRLVEKVDLDPPMIRNLMSLQ